MTGRATAERVLNDIADTRNLPEPDVTINGHATMLSTTLGGRS